MGKEIPAAFAAQGYRFATPEEIAGEKKRRMIDEAIAGIDRGIEQAMEEKTNAETLRASHPDCAMPPGGLFTLDRAKRYVEKTSEYDAKIAECDRRRSELERSKVEAETIAASHPALQPGKGKTYLEHEVGIFVKD